MGTEGWTAGNQGTGYSFAEPLEMEDLPSGLGMAKQDLGQGEGPCRGAQSPGDPAGWMPAQHDLGPSLPQMKTSLGIVVGGGGGGARQRSILVPEKRAVEN